jgi:hypothetical protein
MGPRGRFPAAARDRAVLANSEKHNELELEIAKIKKQDAENLAALSHKLNALNTKAATAAAAHSWIADPA